jgi:hypothetical protein
MRKVPLEVECRENILLDLLWTENPFHLCDGVLDLVPAFTQKDVQEFPVSPFELSNVNTPTTEVMEPSLVEWVKLILTAPEFFFGHALPGLLASAWAPAAKLFNDPPDIRAHVGEENLLQFLGNGYNTL